MLPRPNLPQPHFLPRTSLTKIHQLSLAAASLLSVLAARADVIYWDGSVTANPGSPWAAAANWSTVPGAAAPEPAAAPGAGDRVVFNIDGATARTQVYLDGDLAAQSFTFDSPGGVDIFNNLSGTAPQRLLTVGAGGVTLSPGSGQVIFGAASATFGTTSVQINAPQTWRNHSTGLLSLFGTNATAATIAGGAQLTFAGRGPVQVGPNNTTLANLTGAGGLVMSGTGVLTLFSNSTYSGGTVLNAGTIAIGNAGALGTGGTLTVNGGGLRSASTTTYSLAGKLTGIAVNSDFTLGDTAATGGLTFDAPVNLGAATRTLTVNSTAVFGGTGAGIISGSPGTGLIKTGPGQLTISGTAPHTFDGGLTVKGGTLLASMTNMVTPADLLMSGLPVTLTNSSTFNIAGKNAPSTQTLGSLTTGAGRSVLLFTTGGGASTLAVTLGNTWTRNDSGALHLQMASSSGVTVTSSPPLVHGIVGPWATFYLNTSPNIATYYATVDDGKVVPLTAGPDFSSATQSSALTDTTGTMNYDLTGAGTPPDDTTPAAGFSANTLRYTGTAAGTIIPGGAFSLNGLMNGSNINSAALTIGPGTLTIGSTRELVVNTFTRVAPSGNGITINAAIADNAAGPSGLTVVGFNSATGTHPSPLTLTNANTYTGRTVINGSGGSTESQRTILISALRNSGVNSEFGAGGAVVLNSAVVQTGATGTSDRSLTLAGNSGFYVKGNFTQTLAGAISGTGNLYVDGDFGGSPGGTGNVVLSGDNPFTGDLLFQADSRVTLAHANALKNATLVMSGARILADLSTNNLACNLGGLRGGVGFSLGSATGGGGSGLVTIGANSQSNTFAGTLSGTAGLVKTGTGTQTLTGVHTFAGPVIVDAGRLKLVTTSTAGLTGTGTSGAFIITALASTSGLAAGQPVSGTGAGAGAKIVSVDSPTQVTVSAAHSAALAGTLTFGGQTTSFASPVIEVKSGAVLDVTDTSGYTIPGGQTLAGAGTVEGRLTIAGTLAPGPAAGAGTATLTTGAVAFSATGEYACSLDGAACDALAAGTLTVDPAAKITFTGTPTAPSLVIATYTGAQPAPFVTDASLPAGYTLDYTAPGQVRLVNGDPVSPYQSWAGASGLAGASAAPDADPDNDALYNAVEFVIGGEPNPARPGADSSLLAPTGLTSGPDLIYTFRRTALSLTQPGIGIAAQYGTDLTGWTDVAIPATTPQNPVNGATITITPNGFAPGVDKVEVKLPPPPAPASRLFIRLKVSVPVP